MHNSPYPHRIIEYSEYDVIIPFICHRCGNCCRTFYPSIDPEMLPEVARVLNTPIAVIQAQLGADCEAHNAGTPTDCYFLEPADNTCRIHEVKPEACRLFPSLTDTGLGKVDCPGYREFKNIVGELSKNSGFTRIRKPTASEKLRRIPDHKRQYILLKLEKLNATELFIQKFLVMNKT